MTTTPTARVDYVRRLASAPNSQHSMRHACSGRPSECGGREAMGRCTVIGCRDHGGVGSPHTVAGGRIESASNGINGGSPKLNNTMK